MDSGQLVALANRLTTVDGVVGVILGGSRARGEHLPDSDYDLGIYYRQRLDIAALTDLARAVAGADARVTVTGAWGPWMDGGGWLSVAGAAVDWIYRDLDRVRAAWDGAIRGHFEFNAQVGHPLGFPDFAYAGELALGVILADPTGRLAELRQPMTAYPEALRVSVVGRSLWEASFLIDGAGKAARRADAAYVAGCLFRVVGLCAHALHADAGRWLINEKGAVTAAGALAGAPADFAARGHGLFAALGVTRVDLDTTLDQAADLVRDTAAACQRNVSVAAPSLYR
ncbi:MAG TPA: nucleotidyltransferase domain-containing protein [Micromonosporaceae bacterium]|nr:nucleotidyltransferase domain-containing protein [Micromonosporaceae bacterium]